jgi:16S rRNA (cytosine1402-N4)-methyltransferase
MAREVVQILVSGGVDLLVDATVGAGGHAAGFLEARGPHARVVGLDRDPEMVEIARERLAGFGDRVRVFARSFAELAEVLDGLGLEAVDGALFDLGAASAHFDRPERGFSFLTSGPLDMRYDRREPETAADLVNRTPEPRLVEILEDLGNERHARRIARALVRERPIKDTLRLADVVERAVGGRGRIHAATRSFQALRIALNRELEHIERGIPAAIERLRTGGRLVVISFHSGEDRVVKHLLREEARRGRATLLTRKPMRPHADEVRENPRSRSARLRACERGARE